MHPTERNPRFSNLLTHAASPYLKQHAHNPVFWYPWGAEALERARTENKPILLSIGYSTCYWCHVMEREVFENVSIAALMNRCFINVKVDREEHPQIDEIYMVARQLLTQQGGWPNNVFLTPDLKPFYAGGTYAPDESYGKPAFPRLLEWMHFCWTTKEKETRETAENIAQAMQAYLVYTPSGDTQADAVKQADEAFAMLRGHYDQRAGGFFQSPKFPHECYLQFLLGYYEITGRIEALDMVTNSLSKMAAGGIYDQVGCGFHRYAVDKDWTIPHFEKMLYNQAQMARACADAARLSGNAYLADIARGVLEFTGGPLTSGDGAFYSAIDAETDGVEGAYYAWTEEEFKAVLTEEERRLLPSLFALADIPEFPGHKHVDGRVLILRKPLDQASREKQMPYAQAAAAVGQLMNKLLEARNRRKAPRLDDKIIVSWNGLMIDAFAHAGRVLGEPAYVRRARKAAHFLLEHAIDNEGRLMRVHAGGKAQIPGTLEDYAFLVKGLLSLQRARPEAAVLDAAVSLITRAEELFSDAGRGYFFTQEGDAVPVRVKTVDDGAMPNANAVMLHNLIDLAELTGETRYREQAQRMADYFMNGNSRIVIEYATLIHGAMRLQAKSRAEVPAAFDSEDYTVEGRKAPHDTVTVSATLFPPDAGPGSRCELIISFEIKEGWHIQAHKPTLPYLIPTQVSVQGEGVAVEGVSYPEPLRRPGAAGETLAVYEGMVSITVRLRLEGGTGKRPAIRALARFQPCHGTSCHAVRDVSITI